MQFNFAIILAVVAMFSSAVLSAPAGVEIRALETIDAHNEAAVERYVSRRLPSCLLYADSLLRSYARDPTASPLFERDVETMSVLECACSHERKTDNANLATCAR